MKVLVLTCSKKTWKTLNGKTSSPVLLVIWLTKCLTARRAEMKSCSRERLLSGLSRRQRLHRECSRSAARVSQRQEHEQQHLGARIRQPASGSHSAMVAGQAMAEQSNTHLLLVQRCVEGAEG
jgi:hypothetical protein